MPLKRFQFLIKGFGSNTTGTSVKNYFESHGMVVSFANIKAPTSTQIKEKHIYMYWSHVRMKLLDISCLSCFVEFLFPEETTVEQACSIIQKAGEQFSQPLRITHLPEKEENNCLRDTIRSVNFCWEKDSFFSTQILSYFSSPPKLCSFDHKDNSYNLWLESGVKSKLDSILDSFYFVKLAVAMDGDLLPYTISWTKNRSIVYEAVKFNGNALRCVSGQLLYDKDIIWAALKNASSALEYVPKDMLNDKDIALIAVKYDYKMFEFVGKELQKDKEIQLATLNCVTVQRRHYFYYYYDFDFYFFAKHFPFLFTNQQLVITCDELQYYKEIIMILIPKHPFIFKYLRKCFQRDVDIRKTTWTALLKSILMRIYDSILSKYYAHFLISICNASISTLYRIYCNLYWNRYRNGLFYFDDLELYYREEKLSDKIVKDTEIDNKKWSFSSFARMQNKIRKFNQKDKRYLPKKQRKLKMFY